MNNIEGLNNNRKLNTFNIIKFLQQIVYCMRWKIPKYSKTCLERPLKKKTKQLVFKTDYRLMRVKSIAGWSKRAFVLSIFEWPLKTGFTVLCF